MINSIMIIINAQIMERVVCVIHGTAHNVQEICAFCEYDHDEDIREDVQEGFRRLKWEREHDKELGK